MISTIRKKLSGLSHHRPDKKSQGSSQHLSNSDKIPQTWLPVTSVGHPGKLGHMTLKLALHWQNTTIRSCGRLYTVRTLKPLKRINFVPNYRNFYMIAGHWLILHSHLYTWLVFHTIWIKKYDGLVEDCTNFIAKALEILHLCPKPSIYTYHSIHVKFPNFQNENIIELHTI